MARHERLATLTIGTGLVAASLLAAATPALAGGFAVREQSAEFQGMSYAGQGTSGGGLSSMFWNPATAAFAPIGIYGESHAAAIFGQVDLTAQTGSTLLALGASSGDIAKDALVPAGYFSFRLSDKAVFALSSNSPFGLVTEPSTFVNAGQVHARTSFLRTFNFAPTLAYRLTPSIAVGVGLQIQYIEGSLKRAAGVTGSSPSVAVEGDDLAFGVTAGINYTPTATTHIGLGYRSAIDHTLEGGVFLTQNNPFYSQITADLKLPDVVTLSMRQGITDRFTLLGTVEWTNWSRLQKLDVICNGNSTGNPVFCPAGNGQQVTSLALGWHDGWIFSAGGEYQVTTPLLLRAGVAYEISPIQAPDERSLRVPDVDRLWASIGATYKLSDHMGMDFAYSHVFGIGDDKIDRTESGIRYVGTVDSSADIVSGSLKIKLGGASEPLK